MGLLEKSTMGRKKALKSLATLASVSDELKTLVNEKQENFTRVARMHAFSKARLANTTNVGFYPGFVANGLRKNIITSITSTVRRDELTANDLLTPMSEYVDMCSVETSR